MGEVNMKQPPENMKLPPEMIRTRPWKKEKPWRWEENGYVVTRSHSWSAPGCHGGCGVLLYTKDGRLVKVEGDPDNPHNQGRLCVRCLSLPDVVNHSDRLKFPMKRVGKRGEDKWQQISWDEAYDTIYQKFSDIKEKYGPESVIFAQGTGRDIPAYISRLAYAYGSPHYMCLMSGDSCYFSRTEGMLITAGTFAVMDCSQYFPDRYANPQWKVPETIIVWGNNTVVSNADGFYGHWLVDCMKRGSKLIVVDPRLTWLASRADVWLQIRPGTDAALAMGMLDTIIKEGLYDKKFVDEWTFGFDQLAERAAEYPVARVADITWIPEGKILAAARLFAKSKPAAIQWGFAVDSMVESFPTGRAISSLFLVTGNLDVPGGMITVSPPYGVDSWVGEWGYGEFVSEEAKSRRLGQRKISSKWIQPDDVVETLQTDKPYPVRAAWIQANNPIACMGADPKRLYEGLKKLEFVVVVDVFKTPTAVALADILLPVATYPERDGLRAVWYNVGAINKATQFGETKSDMEINLELGRRFNPKAWPWANVQEMFSDKLKDAGVTFEELREHGGQKYPPFEYLKYEKGLERPDGKPGFNTPSGKVELYSRFLEEIDLDPLPYFEEPTESPLSTPEVYQEYPLVLTTGARTWGFFHSEHRQIARLRALRPDPLVEIHPETAAKYGIRDGDWVWIENRRGRARSKAKITPIIDPRVIHADHAWWYPEKDAAEPKLFGMWDVNINKLVPWLPGRSGYGANYKSLLCRIYRVKDGEM